MDFVASRQSKKTWTILLPLAFGDTLSQDASFLSLLTDKLTLLSHFFDAMGDDVQKCCNYKIDETIFEKQLKLKIPF